MYFTIAKARYGYSMLNMTVGITLSAGISKWRKLNSYIIALKLFVGGSNDLGNYFMFITIWVFGRHIRFNHRLYSSRFLPVLFLLALFLLLNLNFKSRILIRQ